MTQIGAITSILLYIVAIYILWRQLRGQCQLSKLTLLSPGIIALALHGWTVSSSILTSDGLNLSVINALSLTVWTTICLLMLSNIFQATESLGLPVYSLAIIILGVQSISHEPAVIIHADSGVTVHILSSISAFGLITIAALTAGLVAFQHNALRQHKLIGLLRTLPPLTLMENLLFEFIGVGLLLLTASLVTGMLYLEDLFAQHLVHKTVLSITGWLVLTTLMTGRFLFGWRGPKAVRWTIAGFTLLMLGYFGSKVVLELILHQA